MNGMKHGKGTFFYKSGEKYTGDIYENKKTGQGISLKILLKLLLKLINFINKGTYTYLNGDIYEGFFFVYLL